MEYVALGNSGLSVSRIGFGCEPLGGFQWGKVDIQAIQNGIKAALELGVNFFDTADCYGKGDSETRLGQSLSTNRKKAVIATKVGVRNGQDGKAFHDNSESWINTALDESLKRLNTDYIDLYQLHYWDKTRPLSEILEQFEEKRKEGKIRWYGLSNNACSEIKSKMPGLVSGTLEYSLSNLSNQELIKNFQNNFNMTPLLWGVLGQGVLTGKYSENQKPEGDDRRVNARYENFHGDKWKQNLELVEKIKQISNKKPGSLIPQLAIAYVLQTIPGSIALTGIKSEEQLRSNIKALAFHLSADEITFLKG